MSLLRRLVLHRFWIPSVFVVTALAFIPRAREADVRMTRVSRAAGVFDWTSADPNEFGDTRFRWMRRHAALHEPVRGRLLLVPFYVARSGIEARPLTLRVRIAGAATEEITLQKHGWHIASFDLPRLLGDARWQSMRSVTLAFDFAVLAGSSELPEVGLGYVHWEGAPPTDRILGQ